MTTQDMKILIENIYEEVLNNLKVDKIEDYFDKTYLQTTDGLNATYDEFKQHMVTLRKVTKKIQVPHFLEEMFDVQTQKVFLHYIVNVTKMDNHVGHIEVFAIFSIKGKKIIRCEEVTRSLDDLSLFIWFRKIDGSGAINSLTNKLVSLTVLSIFFAFLFIIQAVWLIMKKKTTISE
ncbi:DUF3923 family protein [Leuconostoc rapi]|uniref:DUF3923 family protein n=1 Tax=Leuconostoc rapi TaxID=1406906 RepID=UPI001EF7B018|nr:DUF3923 family protein [Leuconostoc rapi]MBM7435109.1 hypothetical protein [Leuconostoc rapi]